MNKTISASKLPEEFLALPTEKVVEILIRDPNKIVELFGEKVSTFFQSKLLDESMIPVISELLLRLISLTQECNELKIMLARSQEEIAVYFSDGFPV